MPKSSLSSALHAWSLQGPAIINSTLAAKDAEIARLRSERDAHKAQVASLQACIESLQSAVDQLVGLCHAQVDELSHFDQRLEDVRKMSMVRKREPRSASPPREVAARRSSEQTMSTVSTLFDDVKDEEFLEVRDEIRVLPTNTDHSSAVGSAEDDQDEPEEEGEVLSEDAVAVWDDGRVGESSMEKFVVDDRGSARLPILAKGGSEFVDVIDGQCVIRDDAFVVAGEELPFETRVRKGPEGGRWRETSFVEFEYSDGTRLPFVPVTGVRIRGEGEGEGLLENDEGYGQEYVRVVIGEKVFNKLADKASKALEHVWEAMEVQRECVKVGEGLVEVSVKLMRGGSPVWGVVDGAVSCEVSDCLGSGDLLGDATFMVRFVDNFGIAELELVLHRMQVREVV
eukprot:GFKZ01006369.1.p1 GENE.GFKZ01006369.1~~GFKZ01006369.1.p1  ORF type:complete len:399 (-),score=67.58 GFKZ01006369.1:416-1612(-)